MSVELVGKYKKNKVKNRLRKIYAEIAKTPHQLSKGLMDRHYLPENSGMLFAFDYPHHLKFWMYRTYIPLDIAFLDDEGVILQISSMTPLNTKSVVSRNICKYALEVNSGWFSRNKVYESMPVVGINNLLSDNINVFAQNNMLPEDEDNEGNEENLLDLFSDDKEGQKGQKGQEEFSNPDVRLDLSLREKIREADRRGLPMQIVYRSLKGNVMPPRLLIPIPFEGYPMFSGPNGDFFKGYDTSPTIAGGNWDIIGNKPKSFIINNIIALELQES